MKNVYSHAFAARFGKIVFAIIILLENFLVFPYTTVYTGVFKFLLIYLLLLVNAVAYRSLFLVHK